MKLRQLTESLNKKYKKLNEEYSLVGQDGNAFSLMGYTAKCMKECGLRNEITQMRERAMSGDYYNLIRVCDEYIQKCNAINSEDEFLDEEIKRYSDVVPKEQRKYWYFTTHGVQPGSIPKDLNVLEIRDGKNDKGTNGTFVCLDGVLNTSELRDYDMKEQSPGDLDEEYSDLTFDKNRFCIKLDKHIPHSMRYKECDVIGDTLYWVTQENYSKDDSFEFSMAFEDIAENTPVKKAYVVVRDKSSYNFEKDLKNKAGEWYNNTLNHDDLTESYNSFNWHGQVKIGVHDNDPKWPDEYVCQVDEIHPYDDAEYAWAKKVSPVSAKIIQNGKVIETISVPEWDDEVFEDENEYYNEVIDVMVRAIRKINKDVEPIMVHN